MHMRQDDADGAGGPRNAEEAEVRQRNSKDGDGAAAEPEVDGATGTSTQQDAHFECNICLDTAKDAVVSRCGHLFCWPCLYQWLETRPTRQTCPVCKAGISKENVIPLYGRGSTNQQDPREKLPPRPQGERPEPENHGPFHNFGIGDGFQMSFGIGAFPFGFFASTFNIGNGQFGGHPPRPNVPHNPEEQFLSKVFLWVAVLFMFWLLMA